MNKQELLNEIEAMKRNPDKIYKSLTFQEAFESTVNKAKDLVEQLDEPQKVKVPAFVAEWFEENKEYLEYSIFCLCKDTFIETQHNEMMKWNNDEKNKPIETLIRMQDGYEVEQEQRWAVKLKFGRQYLSENSDRTALDFYSCMFPVRSYSKKELAAVEDGAFYKMDGDKEWINPIIELIPAEEV